MSDTIPPKTDQPDLDKLRDEKCIPIAREVLADMATSLVAEDANDKIDHNPIILKILKKALDNDLNISMEVPYLFQLILGVFSGLNSAVQKTSPVPIDDVKYGAVAKKILSMVSEANVRMGGVTPEETATDFAPIMEKLNAYFKEQNLSFLEIKYVMDNIFQSFTRVNNLFNENLAGNSARAEAKLFGIESMSDLTMRRLNDVLIAPILPKDIPSPLVPPEVPPAPTA
jgi:hypothetical protein